MTTAMAQHLLLAADRYQLIRLRTMCERRLCDSVEVDSVATTLMLADKSNASKLRQVWPSLQCGCCLGHQMNAHNLPTLCDCIYQLEDDLAAYRRAFLNHWVEASSWFVEPLFTATIQRLRFVDLPYPGFTGSLQPAKGPNSPVDVAAHVPAAVQVCLTFVANNLSQVICTDDYKRLTESCQGMVNEILAAVAVQGNQTVARGTSRSGAAAGGATGGGAALHANAAQVGVVGGRLRARRRDDELRALE